MEMNTVMEKIQERKDFYDMTSNEREPYYKKANKIRAEVENIVNCIPHFVQHHEKLYKDFSYASGVVVEDARIFDGHSVYYAEIAGHYYDMLTKRFEALVKVKDEAFSETEIKAFLKLFWRTKKLLKKQDDSSRRKYLLPFLTPGTVVKLYDHHKNHESNFVKIVSVNIIMDNFSQIVIENPEKIIIGNRVRVNDLYNIGRIERIEKYNPGKLKVNELSTLKYVDYWPSEFYDHIENMTTPAFTLDQALMNRINFEKVAMSLWNLNLKQCDKLTPTMRKHIRRNQNRFLFSFKELHAIKNDADRKQNEDLGYDD